MTQQEKERERALQHKLTYGRGIAQSDWPELIELRKKSLIEQGENPDHWNLGSRYCSKKLAYRN